MTPPSKKKKEEEDALSYAGIQPSTIRVRGVSKRARKHGSAMIEFRFLLVGDDIVKTDRLEQARHMNKRCPFGGNLLYARTVSQEETKS